MPEMTKKKLHLKVIAVSIATIFFNSFYSPIPVEADDKPSQTIPSDWKNAESPDFSGDGRPKRTAGGASRGECQVENNLPLTALIPDTSVALTVSQSPTFWFYVPYILTSEQSVEFVLKNSRDEYVYTTKMTGKEITSPGIVGLHLPSTVTIDAEVDYDWYFLVYCEPQNLDKFVYVNGSVRRVDRPYLSSSLESPLPEKKLDFYATEGLWYDAVTHLARRAIANPQDATVKNDWTKLLQSVGLSELAEKPFVSCCSLKRSIIQR